MLLWKILTLQSARKCSCMPNLYDFSLSLLKKAENVSMDLCSLWLWVWQCHHGFCRLHRLSLPFVMPEIYHEQFEQKMGTPTRHYHHYTDESIIKSGRPMSSALISQPFSLTLPCCTGGTSFMKSNWGVWRPYFAGIIKQRSPRNLPGTMWVESADKCSLFAMAVNTQMSRVRPPHLKCSHFSF